MKLEGSVFCVEGSDGQLRGAGFVISPTLGVTCVHVVEAEELLQERCLLHLAASRARDTLTISSCGVASPFVAMNSVFGVIRYENRA